MNGNLIEGESKEGYADVLIPGQDLFIFDDPRYMKILHPNKTETVIKRSTLFDKFVYGKELLSVAQIARRLGLKVTYFRTFEEYREYDFGSDISKKRQHKRTEFELSDVGYVGTD